MEDSTLQLRIAGLIAGRVPAHQELQIAQRLLDEHGAAVAGALRQHGAHSFFDSRAADELAILANELSAKEGRYGVY